MMTNAGDTFRRVRGGFERGGWGRGGAGLLDFGALGLW
jgi:hypothetical protein